MKTYSVVFLNLFVLFTMMQMTLGADMVLEGAINGKYQILMTLQFQDETVSGTYFYTSQKKDIMLQGQIDPNKNIVLAEYDPDGNKTGAFTGKLSADGEFQGHWSNAEGSKTFPFELKVISIDEKDDAQSDIPYTLTDLGIFEKRIQEEAFNLFAGEDYLLFVERFQLVYETNDLDNFNAKVHSGGVRGLFTFMEAIIMYNTEGIFWAAAIDDEVVKYFTNDPDHRSTLPKTIDAWRANFTDNKVEYIFRDNQAVPKWIPGQWERIENQFYGASLNITNVMEDHFEFQINAANGGNIGEVSGTAKFTGNKAVFYDQESGCQINFEHVGTLITVDTTQECSYFGGNGVYFGGDYKIDD